MQEAAVRTATAMSVQDLVPSVCARTTAYLAQLVPDAPAMQIVQKEKLAMVFQASTIVDLQSVPATVVVHRHTLQQRDRYLKDQPWALEAWAYPSSRKTPDSLGKGRRFSILTPSPARVRIKVRARISFYHWSRPRLATLAKTHHASETSRIQRCYC
jgi:hypothetical protein